MPALAGIQTVAAASCRARRRDARTGEREAICLGYRTVKGGPMPTMAWGRVAKQCVGAGLLVSLLGISGCGKSKLWSNIQRARATYVARYPWVEKPIDEEHQSKLCEALQLPSDNPFCKRPGKTHVATLMKMLEARFPINETRYDEVAQALHEFPWVKQESVYPGGTVTSRCYAYQLTQFQNFCVYFEVNLGTNVVEEIDCTLASGLSDGPPTWPCVPPDD
jgi:hypothetical protein